MMTILVTLILVMLFGYLTTGNKHMPLSIIKYLIMFVFLLLNFLELELNSVNDWLLILLAAAIIINIEIGVFKFNTGDKERIFLIHIFTLLLFVGYVILLVFK